MAHIVQKNSYENSNFDFFWFLDFGWVEGAPRVPQCPKNGKESYSACHELSVEYLKSSVGQS